MPGVIVLTSTGLILAEICESYPGSWTFERSGSTTALGKLIDLAHSGSGAFELETLDSWPASAYARLYKSVDVKTGANRIARLFRGPGIVAGIYDDFPGTSLDTANKWTVTNGSPTVSGGILTIPAYAVVKTKSSIVPLYQTVLAKIKPAVGFDWDPYIYDPVYEYIKVQFGGGTYTDHIHLLVAAPTGGQDVDCGVMDATQYAVYKVVWNASAVTLYKDDAQIGQVTNANAIPYHGPAYVKLGNFGAGLIDWAGWLGDTNHYKASVAIGSQTLFDQDVETETRSLNNGFFDSTWLAVTPTGSQTVELKFCNASVASEGKSAQCTFDDLAIMLDSIFTIKGLLGGQKIELYNSGGGLLKTGTCPQTGVDVILTGIDALISTAYGLSSYFKVYDTDGSTLLYTSPTEARWGGDVYTWIPNESKCDITTDYTLIYRSGSGLSPTSCTVTVTLTDKGTGAKLSGKTINWTGNLGTCNPTSNQTDVNGQAATIFTAGANPGLGGVRGAFAGDATYGPSSALQLIDIYYGQVSADSLKDFQVWIAGQEAVIGSGNYKLASDFKPQSFTFTTPVMSLSVGGWWAIEVYRKGVKDFGGRIFTRDRQGGANPQVTVTGVDEIIMLQKRVANKSYTDEPKLIIEDLLTRYPCGVTAGTIALYGAIINLPATYENLYDALMQIAKITGWKFRLNADKTLDFGSSFGTSRNITIAIGVNAVLTSHKEDWSQIDTKVYVVGAGSGAGLVSTAEDPGGQLTYGLIEEAFLEKNINQQGTLDLRAQEILDQRKGVIETIGAEWIDSLATGAYGPHDSLTVTDAEVGISGPFVVKSISRDLTDANKAGLELANRLSTIADALQSIRKDVKDLGVA